MEDQSKNKTSVWTHGLAINLLSNAIAAFVGIVVTYLSHNGSAWIKPVLCGGAAWFLTFCSILAYRISKHLPTRGKPIDINNVQLRIRDWLDKFNLTVKSMSTEDSYFFFIVTTDGGKKISVSRPKGEFSEYILVKGLVTTGDAEHAILESFSDEEKVAAALAINLELSRAVMGYKSEKGVLEDITIFKRIPITPLLNAEEVLRLIWEVEAMLASIFTVNQMASHRHIVKNKNVGQS